MYIHIYVVWSEIVIHTSYKDTLQSAEFRIFPQR